MKKSNFINNTVVDDFVGDLDDLNVFDSVEDDAIILGSVIEPLNSLDDSEESNGIIYKSKNEYIREAAIYGFALLCIVIIVALITKGIRWQKSKQIL